MKDLTREIEVPCHDWTTLTLSNSMASPTVSPLYLYPMSLYPHVPIPPCPYTPMSLYPHVPVHMLLPAMHTLNIWSYYSPLPCVVAMLELLYMYITCTSLKNVY